MNKFGSGRHAWRHFPIKAPKNVLRSLQREIPYQRKCSLRIIFLFLEDFGAPLWKRCRHSSLVAPFPATLRYYRCDTPYRAIHFFRDLRTPPKWCDAPPWVLSFTGITQICVIPHFATYRAIIVRYSIKNKKKQARNSFAILSLQASRDMESIAAGPLSTQATLKIGIMIF